MHQPFSTTHVPWRARLPLAGAVDRETEWRARNRCLFESGTTSSNPSSSSGESSANQAFVARTERPTGKREKNRFSLGGTDGSNPSLYIRLFKSWLNRPWPAFSH
jgi:hypothetical protein